MSEWVRGGKRQVLVWIRRECCKQNAWLWLVNIQISDFVLLFLSCFWSTATNIQPFFFFLIISVFRKKDRFLSLSLRCSLSDHSQGRDWIETFDSCRWILIGELASGIPWSVRQVYPVSVSIGLRSPRRSYLALSTRRVSFQKRQQLISGNFPVRWSAFPVFLCPINSLSSVLIHFFFSSSWAVSSLDFFSFIKLIIHHAKRSMVVG